MCLFIGSDTILANILVDKDEQEGIGVYEIKRYCQELNELLDRKKLPYRYFDISHDSLRKAVLVNRKAFLSFGGKYFRRAVIQIEDYNSIYDEEIREVFAAASSRI